MISLAALFSFQGTDRPKATRRTPGAPVLRRKLDLTKNRATESRFFCSDSGSGKEIFRAAAALEKIVSREGNGIICTAHLEVKGSLSVVGSPREKAADGMIGRG